MNQNTAKQAAASAARRADKAELLAIIRRAKSVHIQWRAHAQALVSGVPVAEDKVPVRHTDCKFGQWYYGLGHEQLGHIGIFEDIESPHELLHRVYAQLYGLVQKQDFDEARKKLDELVGISRTLLEMMDLLEREVSCTAD